MKNAVFYCAFNLVEGASVEEFIEVSKELNDNYISKQKGYVSWQQLRDGDDWLDLVTFETMEDVQSFASNPENEKNPFALKYFSFVKMEDCKATMFSVEAEWDK